MENIKYYEDLRNSFILAYEKSTEFFVIFVSKEKGWADCSISFSSFIHDYEFREISKEDAIKKTDGSLPESLYYKYLDMLSNNLG